MEDKKARIDPFSYPPRGMSRTVAARYIGVSATKFDEMVKSSHMPKPKRIGIRTVWDRWAIDHAFSDLPDARTENYFDRALSGERIDP